MLRYARRAAGVAWLTGALALAGSASAQAATIPFTNWTVSGSLTLAKLHQSATLPPGSTFNGSVDTSTGKLTGNVNIPTFTTHLRVLGLPLDATLQFVPTGPATGTATIGATTTISATASAIIRLTRVSSPILPINLVGSRCQTSRPVVLPLNYSGPLTAGFTFTGEVTIPPLEHCGLSTPLLNLLMAGPNNPFTITIAP